MVVVIGRCLLLFISLLGLTLSVDDRFSEDDIATFLDYIFRLNNMVRTKHDVPELFRTNAMDNIAYQKLIEVIQNREDHEDPLGVIYDWRKYDNSTQLDVAEAIEFFSQSYEQGNFYDYTLEPNDRFSVDFTQIVWRESTQIGFAFICQSYRYLVLSVYYDRGNIEGSYLLNVQRPIHNLPLTDPDIAGLTYETGKEKFINNMLELHKEARIKHYVKLLMHNEHMDELANEILRERSQLTTEYGMNRLRGKYFGRNELGEKAAANEFFSTWYNEEIFYNYHRGVSTRCTDSFTQIVWMRTRQIGIGIRLWSGNEHEVLVLYRPPGNVPRRFKSNVFIPRNRNQGESSGNN